MKRYEVKYDLVMMNIIGIVYTIFLIGLVFVLFKNNILVGNFNDFPSLYDDKTGINLYWFIFFILYFIWMILHEIIHAVFYVIGGAEWKNVSFGVALEKSILYCKCGEDIDKKNIMTSLLAPFMLIGVFTGVISFIIGSYMLLFLSIFNIIGACADLTMFVFFLRRKKDIKFREVLDTSTFVLSTSENFDNKKFLGIKSIRLLKDNELLKEKNVKKIEISKWSKVFILILCIFILLDIILMFMG